MNPLRLAARLGLLLALAPVSHVLADSPHRTNQSGVKLYREGKYAEARAEFEKGLSAENTRVDDAAALSFNQGLADLQLGAVDGASASFTQAMGSPDPALRAKAAYAAGNAWVKKAGTGGEEPEALQQSIAHLDTAQDFFEKALEADPALAEASANHELAQSRQQQFKKKLGELKKKEEEQKKNDPNQDKKDEEKKEQDKKDQEKKDQEKKDQEKKDQQQDPSDKSDPSDQDKQEQEKKEQQEKEQERKEQEQKEQQQQKEGKEGKDQPGQPGQPPPKPNEMSAEQAQMLLNAMMNDEKQQREAIRVKLMKAGPDITVEKDY